MWKNNNRGKKRTTDWRGRGRKFGNNRRSGTKTFNRRQSPDRTNLSLKDDRGSGLFNEDKNLKYGADDERDRRPFFEDNRHVVERDSRLLDENNFDGLHSRQFISENSERDGFRTDDIDRYNNADLYNRDVSNQNRDLYFDRRDDFVGLDQDRVYSTDREFDNRRYRVGDYDRGVDLKYDEPLTDSVRDTEIDGMPDWRLRDEMPIGEVDRWNRDNNSQYENSLRGGLQGYDNQSVDRKDYGNIRGTKYNYGESDHVTAEYRTDKHQSTDYKQNLHDLSGDHYKTIAHDRRDTKERGNRDNRDLVGNSSKQSYRRNDSVPCKQEKLKSAHGPKGEARSGRHHVTNIRHRETVVKQHGNQLDKPIKNINLRKSDQSRRSSGSSQNKDSKKDTMSNTLSSKNLKHSKDDKKSRDKAGSERNRHSSKLGSRRDETEKLNSYSKNNQNKSDFNNRAGLKSNQPRSGSKEDNKRRPSNRSTPDSKGQRSGRSKTDNDSFKKPSDRQQPNTTRSSSGRRVESDFGHVKDDDILSIMADDDGFDNEHKPGNASTSSLMPRKHGRDADSREKGASNRTKCDRDGFHRQNNKSELERNMEPVFEIHAESSASIFGDNSDRQEKYRSGGKSDGTRSSSFRDHSREKRTVSGNKSAVSYTEDRHIFTDRSAERYPKGNRESTSKSRYGRVREEFGKTGAVLREDRPDSSNKVKVGVQKYNFQRKVQNFKTGPRNGNQFSKSKFGNKNFTYSDRVKRKYLKGGFKSFGYDRDLPRFKGNYDGREAKGREAWKSRVDDRSERIDKRNLRNDSRNENFDNTNIEVHDKNQNFDDFSLKVDQQVDSNQQIVFIPNQDMKTSVPPMLDQFGRVIYNADLPEQSIEGQIPVRYISEQYPSDGTAVGEQLVFIPFVNQMPNYSENMSNPLDNVSRVEVKDEPVIKSSQNSKSKPLSTSARAVMRKKLEAKRKKRMEEEIERKLLKKLFGTSSLAQAVKREESSQVKKKPVLKRISPPSGNKPTHIHKTVKLVKKTDGITDISDEDDADQYDSVSDLEDVSDEDDYEMRRDKRPVFRKPGQPRKGNRKQGERKANNSDDDDDHKSHDIRRVVQSSSSQESGRSENVRGQKRQRSMYDEDPVIYSQQSNARGQPDRFARKKNRRSMSPIEITVSNERYSKTSSTRRRETESNKDGHKKRGGDFVRKETSIETRSHSLEDQKYDHEGDHHGSNRHRSGERSEVKRFEGARYRQEESPNKFEARRNVHAHSNFEKSQMSNDRQSFGYGKYRDKSEEDSYTDKGRYTVSKYRSERDNNYRSDEQYEWERNVSDNGKLGNKNQSRSSRNDVLDRADCHGQFDGINDGDELNRGPTGGSPSNFSKNAFRGTFQTNPSFAQQSTDGQSFSQSISLPLQFSKTGSGVDHSLPPVQNAPIPMPPFPPVSLGVRPDMSLPPPVGTMGNHSPMMQASNANNFQQSFGIQSQQHYHSLHQQFPQQQQQQMQAIQQNQSQFQMQQPMFNPGMGQNQMGMQQIQPNQFQQTQSNVGIVPLNQTLMSDHMTPQLTAQVPQLNQGNYKQVIKTSHNQQAFVTTNSQGVRGVIGTIKTSGSGSQPGRRVAQVETGSPGHTAVLSRAAGRTDVKQSPNSNKLPQDGDAYFDDLVQMVCSKCNSVLLDHGMMKAHGRWHDMIESNNKNWRCDQCEQGYLSSAAYADHMSDKHTYNSWNCSLCNLSFSNSSGLNKHIRHSTHKNLKVKFVCSLCPASFMVLTHLVQHKKEIHQSSSGYSGYRKF